jgi:hypothetical protein
MCREEDNFQIDNEDIECEDVDWIKPTQDRFEWRDVVIVHKAL